jgi:hypothetical protein
MSAIAPALERPLSTQMIHNHVRGKLGQPLIHRLDPANPNVAHVHLRPHPNVLQDVIGGDRAGEFGRQVPANVHPQPGRLREQFHAKLGNLHSVSSDFAGIARRGAARTNSHPQTQ